MRALILLLLVVVAFLLVVKFYPSTVAGGGGEEPVSAPAAPSLPEPAPAPAHFLTRAAEEVERTPTPAVSAPATAANAMPEWLARTTPPLVRDEGELAVAAALVHGTPQDVVAAVQSVEGFPAARALMAEAFARAVDGDPRAGLRVASRIDETGLEARERELLQGVLGAKPVRARPASASAESPLVLAMEMRLAASQGEAYLAGGRAAEAARVLSDLLLRELSAPWPTDAQSLAAWTATLDRAQREHRWNRRGEWPAVEMTVAAGDSLIAVRKRYVRGHPGRVMSVGLIRRANGIPEGSPIQPGQVLRLPSDPVRVLVDLSARWALYFLGDEVAGSWPVGIGKPGEETPTGEYIAKDKVPNPPWMKVGQEPIPFGDTRNPLGARWIGWYQDGIKTSYGFHGTTDPESVGRPSSDGCVRLLDADVELLFEILPEGATILVRR